MSRCNLRWHGEMFWLCHEIYITLPTAPSTSSQWCCLHEILSSFSRQNPQVAVESCCCAMLWSKCRFGTVPHSAIFSVDWVRVIAVVLKCNSSLGNKSEWDDWVCSTSGPFMCYSLPFITHRLDTVQLLFFWMQECSVLFPEIPSGMTSFPHSLPPPLCLFFSLWGLNSNLSPWGSLP